MSIPGSRRFWLIAQALFYVGAGLNHFRVPDFYARLMPPYLPAHHTLVLLSGAVEIGLGVGLLPLRTRRAAAWAIVAMLVVFLTVHVHMLRHPAEYPDVPVALLWARLPLQALLIRWAYIYARPRRTVPPAPAPPAPAPPAPERRRNRSDRTN